MAGLPSFLSDINGFNNPTAVASAMQSTTAPSVSSPAPIVPVPQVNPSSIIRDPGATGSGANTGFGWNLGTGALALGGLQTLAGIYSAFNAQELAQDQFDFQKRVTGANMANQIASYNTALADRMRARAIGENGHNGGMTMRDVAPYMQKNSLKPVFLG